MGCRLKRAVAAGAALAVCATGVLSASAAAQNPALPPTPIPEGISNSPEFIGSAASINPIYGVKEPPRHPFMAPNGRSNIHNDAFQTDAYTFSGPLGDGIEVSNFFARECASVLFDSQGRIVTVCVGLDRSVLALLNPVTLQVLAAMQLPVRSAQGGTNPFTDFSGGGYFYLDHRDRAVVPTFDRHVVEVAITSGPSFTVTRDYDLQPHIESNDAIISVLPDWSGRLWFVTRRGLVGTIDRDSGSVRKLRLGGEGISNSFAVDDEGGVFIVSDAALYRFDAGPNGDPVITWREPYPDSGAHKPGQSDAGSGTTPTLIGSKWLTITDNADPMNIRVYRRQKRLKPKDKQRQAALDRTRSQKKRLRLKQRWRTRTREVCAEPIFARGASATDQSLIAVGNTIIAENNYGYAGPTTTEMGGTTSPGLVRVDIVPKPKKKKGDKDKGKRGKKGKGGKAVAAKRKGKKDKRKKRRVKRYECRTVWTSAERAPSVVPKVSLATGLVYTYTKPAGTGSEDPWYFTAIDYRTGQTVFKRFSGEGLGHNNHYAPVTLGPDGTAYVGVLGGIVAFR